MKTVFLLFSVFCVYHINAFSNGASAPFKAFVSTRPLSSPTRTPRFAEDGESKSTEDTIAQAAAAGELYDDMIPETPPTSQSAGLSNSMREKLMREAATGLDSEEKQTNVLLYIMLAVAALVAVGGQGILF